MLACAESCTGGWIAKMVTDVAGSSQWFDRGFVSYSNLAKQQMLAVPAELIAKHGAVSEAVVKAMTSGVLANSAADIAVAVSGIAGPGGGSAHKPVGTVCIGWGTRSASWVHTELFSGNRDEVRIATVISALQRLVALVRE